jgi:serralysin
LCFFCSLTRRGSLPLGPQTADQGPGAASDALSAGPLAAPALGVSPLAALTETERSGVPLSGRAAVDALLTSQRWGSGDGPVTLSYSFPVAGSAWRSDYGPEINSWSPLTAGQREAVREALATWAQVANIRFVEVAETAGAVGELRFARTGAFATAGAYLPADPVRGGDVWLGFAVFGNGADLRPGTYPFLTLVHEIGHALGLKHPHDPGTNRITASPQADWVGATVMSYRSYPEAPVEYGISGNILPTTPMPDDIAAIQHLYGANPNASRGSDTYRFLPGQVVFETLVDLGGVDTIDWSRRSDPIDLDLRPGFRSDLGRDYVATGPDGATWRTGQTFALAPGTWIERALGGAGDDRIRGNAVANDLRGRDGDDDIRGDGGNDLVRGGAGRDMLRGGNGDDQLIGSGGDDRLIGGAGRDRLDGGSGNDGLAGGEGNDILVGGTGRDLLEGGAGNDELRGGDGNDLLDGGAGRDVLRGDAGDDELRGGEANDILDGGAGRDQLFGGSGDDALRGGAGNDVLDGGAGRDMAEFAGPRSSYAIRTMSGGYTVTDLIAARGGGSDLLTSIELVRFDDVTLRLG